MGRRFIVDVFYISVTLGQNVGLNRILPQLHPVIDNRHATELAGHG